MKLIIIAVLSFFLPGEIEKASIADAADLFRPGARLTIEVSDGRVSTMRIVSRRKAVAGNGQAVERNEDGNTVRSGDTVFSPHSAYRQPGGGGRAVVGATWSQQFRRGEATRRRTCEVTGKGAYRNERIEVRGAFLVECVNERSPGQPPLIESIWFHEVPGCSAGASQSSEIWHVRRRCAWL